MRGSTRHLDVCHTWDGAPLEDAECVRLTVERSSQGVLVEVDAPWHGDPPPAHPVGPTPALWEHEVVEVFIAGMSADGAPPRYLEIELGPHGHHLVLWLEGVRAPRFERLPLDYRVERAGGRWRGSARTDGRVPLPDEPWRLNAYAIHGTGPARRHLAHAPLPGGVLDFHQPDRFVAWDALRRHPAAIPSAT